MSRGFNPEPEWALQSSNMAMERHEMVWHHRTVGSPALLTTLLAAVLTLCAACDSEAIPATTSDQRVTSTEARTTTTGWPMRQLLGRWDLTEYRVGDKSGTIEVTDISESPHVLLSEHSFDGQLTCNQVSGTGVGYELTTERVVLGEFSITDAGCRDMETETALAAAIQSGPFTIELTDTTMTWFGHDAELIFTR